eukprot:351882-Chlamydomonas_euryale.AAC.9
MHPLLTAALAVLGVVFAAVVMRLAQATILRGRAPPIFEDIPFVGGLMKFLKVRAQAKCAAVHLRCAVDVGGEHAPANAASASFAAKGTSRRWRECDIKPS